MNSGFGLLLFTMIRQLIELILKRFSTPKQGAFNNLPLHISALFFSLGNFLSSLFSVNSQLDSKRREIRNKIVSICQEIIANIESPEDYLNREALSFYFSACLRTAIHCHVAEVLRARDPQNTGMHVTEIAKYSAVDPTKLTRVLRLLTVRHIFKEVEPEVFCHTKISKALDTRKDPEFFTPENKINWFEGSHGTVCLNLSMSERGSELAACLPELLTDPKYSHSEDETHCLVKFLGEENSKGKTSWDMMNENKIRTAWYNKAMMEASFGMNAKEILQAFNWNSVPQGGTIVDVAGGIGHHTAVLREARPDCKFIIQDRSIVIEQAKAFWEVHDPTALKEGKVVLMVHDYYEEQTVKGADVYFLRHIIHDHPDTPSIKILSQLASACKTTSKILVIDKVLNFGGVATQSVHPYLLDLHMMTLFWGKERTEKDWVDLMKRVPLKIEGMSGDLTGVGRACISCSASE